MKVANSNDFVKTVSTENATLTWESCPPAGEFITGGVSYRNKSLPFNDKNTFFHDEDVLVVVLVVVVVVLAGLRSQTHDM